MTVFSKYFTESIYALKTLDPIVHPVFLELYWRIAMSGIYFRVSLEDGAKRTPEKQKELYNKNPPVTSVLCPHSYHCHGLALDFTALRLLPTFRNGYPTYEAHWSTPFGERAYDTIATHASQLGIDWGFKVWGQDKPHFHYTGGLTLKQIARGKKPPKPTFNRREKDKKVIRVYNRLVKQGVLE